MRAGILILGICLLGFAGNLFTSCCESRPTDLEKRLQSTIEWARERRDSEGYPACKMFEEILFKLMLANEKTLRHPEIAAVYLRAGPPGEGRAFVFWIEEKPTVEQIRFVNASTGDSVTLDVPPRYRYCDSATESTTGILFGSIFIIAEHPALWKVFWTDGKPNPVRVFLLRDGEIVSSTCRIVWGESSKEVPSTRPATQRSATASRPKRLTHPLFSCAVALTGGDLPNRKITIWWLDRTMRVDAVRLVLPDERILLPISEARVEQKVAPGGAFSIFEVTFTVKGSPGLRSLLSRSSRPEKVRIELLRDGKVVSSGSRLLWFGKMMPKGPVSPK